MSALAPPLPPLELQPGLTLCADCRIGDAEATWEPGERWQEFLCLGCADLRVEHMAAFGLNREAVELLDRARGEVRTRPLPVPPVDLETADTSKLQKIRRQWAAFQTSEAAAAMLAGRCRAMLPDGSRCLREAAGEAGACETHVYMGYRLPGFWTAAGEPIGALVSVPGRRGNG